MRRRTTGREGQRDKRTDRQTERQKDRQTDGQTDRQTDRDTKTVAEAEKENQRNRETHYRMTLIKTSFFLFPCLLIYYWPFSSSSTITILFHLLLLSILPLLCHSTPLPFAAVALWSRATRNPDIRTGPLAHPFTHLLACSAALIHLLTRSLTHS